MVQYLLHYDDAAITLHIYSHGLEIYFTCCLILKTVGELQRQKCQFHTQKVFSLIKLNKIKLCALCMLRIMKNASIYTFITGYDINLYRQCIIFEDLSLLDIHVFR